MRWGGFGFLACAESAGVLCSRTCVLVLAICVRVLLCLFGCAHVCCLLWLVTTARTYTRRHALDHLGYLEPGCDHSRGVCLLTSLLIIVIFIMNFLSVFLNVFNFLSINIWFCKCNCYCINYILYSLLFYCSVRSVTIPIRHLGKQPHFFSFLRVWKSHMCLFTPMRTHTCAFTSWYTHF